MSKKDDDSVEQFFRKAAGQYDTQYNDRDWQKLEQRLDEEAARLALVDARRMARYRRMGLVALVVLLTVGWTSFVVYKNYVDNSLTESLTVVNLADGEDATLNNTENGIHTDATGNTDRSELLQEQKQTKTDDISGSIKSSNIPANDLIRSSGQNQNSSFKERPLSNKLDSQGPNASDNKIDRTGEESKNTYSKNSAGSTSAAPENEQSVGLIRESFREQLPQEERDLRRLPEGTSSGHDGKGNVDPLVDSALIADNAIDAPTQEPSVDETRDKKTRRNNTISRFSARLVAAPDFSSTSPGKYTSPGEAYGLLVHYHVSKWSISTGMLRSTKKYSGYGHEYKPPQGYWRYATNGVIPEKVDGNCVVLEIPLSLAYNVIETQRGRLFVTAGVSSYLMRSEDYRYTFEGNNPGAQGWATDKPSSYLFSIGSMSLGYEHDVTPSIAIGLEPYYRIPFSGVGWANVQLHSAGVFLSLRYRFLSRGHPPPLVPE